MNKYDEIRKILDEKLEVYYTKRNPELNKERERNKEKTIKWLISQYKLGPVKGGVIQTDKDLPDYCIWYSDLWEAHKAAIKLRDPLCRICNKNPTEEIHHIRPRFLNGSKLSPRNLIGLCRECHDEVHRNIDSNITKIIEESLAVPIDNAQRTLEGWDDEVDQQH